MPYTCDTCKKVYETKEFEQFDLNFCSILCLQKYRQQQKLQQQQPKQNTVTHYNSNNGGVY